MVTAKECLLERVFVLDFALDRSKLLGMDTSCEKYRAEIAECWRNLKGFELIRDLAEEKISDYRDLIRANANFLPAPERNSELMVLEVFRRPTNITEAVKLALILGDARQERLTPTQIKEQAEKRGFDFSGYTNPLASIHTTLRRMKEADPPEIDYDEAAGTYGNHKYGDTMWQMADPAFYKRTNERILSRMMELDKERLTAVALEEMQKAFRAVIEKPKKK